MMRVRVLFVRVRNRISEIPLKTIVTVILEGLGFLANIIAVGTFLGAINTPVESPNFYINSQEFFVWSLIAMTYIFGLISARIKRRWRRIRFAMGDEDDVVEGWDFFRGWFHWEMFKREFSFTIASTFILTFLYVRAMQAAVSEGKASPWLAFGTTILVWIPATFGVMLMSSILDKALSLYEGD